MMKLSIRSARVEDADDVVAMARCLSIEEQQPETPFGSSDFLHHGFGPHPLFTAIVAESRGKLVGYAFSTRTYDTQIAAPVREILDLFVRPEARRRGIATGMVAAIRDEARRKGECSVVVRTWARNTEIGCTAGHCRR